MYGVWEAKEHEARALQDAQLRYSSHSLGCTSEDGACHRTVKTVGGPMPVLDIYSDVDSLVFAINSIIERRGDDACVVLVHVLPHNGAWPCPAFIEECKSARCDIKGFPYHEDEEDDPKPQFRWCYYIRPGYSIRMQVQNFLAMWPGLLGVFPLVRDTR